MHLQGCRQGRSRRGQRYSGGLNRAQETVVASGEKLLKQHLLLVIRTYALAVVEGFGVFNSLKLLERRRLTLFAAPV